MKKNNLKFKSFLILFFLTTCGMFSQEISVSGIVDSGDLGFLNKRHRLAVNNSSLFILTSNNLI